jgi:ABC-type glycerol-3-phosphate transport system substrate-binding protein
MTDNHAPKTSLSRRSFVLKTAATGLAVAGGADLIRSLTSPSAAAAASRAASGTTFTLNDMPAPSDKVNVTAFNLTVSRFEKTNPSIKVIGKTDTFDPTTFYAHYAVGNVEDTYKVYFTDVQHLIQLGYAKDISTYVKGWQYYSSIAPGVKQIISDASGKIYGLPVDGYALGLAYNKKLFVAAGLDPDKPPLTWTQFRQYAKKLTDASKGRHGFAPLSLSNTGGWHLTAMIYSFGGQPQIVKNGRTLANFNDAHGVQALQLLRDMRWVDQSIGPKEMGYNDNTAALANNSIAMGILAGDQPRFFKTQYQADLNDFILAGLPQGGGNATLTGGDVQLVKPNATEAIAAAALEFTEYRYFDLPSWEASDKAQVAGGGAVGIPANIAYGGALKKALDAIDAKYANVPTQNYKFFVQANNTLNLRPEPRIQSQKMYALLDTCVQAILSDKSANPKALLDNAAKQFQVILDAAKS